MNAKKIHSPMAKASCTASTAAAVPSSTRSPPPDSAYLDAPDRDELVIKMPASADDAQMDRIKVYCDAMLSMHGIPIEDALYELSRQQWDIRAAEQHLSAVVKEDREWSEADKDLFHVGFTKFGKEFDKIRLLLPHKPLGAIIKYYYDTKKLQFYRTFSPEESGEIDDGVPKESGASVCNEEANAREDACAGCLTVVDCQVVPHKSLVSNLSDDMENMEMQADNDVQHLASPVKRSSCAAEAGSGAKKLKNAIVCK
ncbi:Protein RCOR-1 a [Aphelenchoides avenae]|nr:Protein RCOR-1 a [Aphelenchus avenae]